MVQLNSRREGFALAAAVLAMLVVGAIVTGGFYAASQEQSITKSSDAGDMALFIAETGLNNTLGAVTASQLTSYALPSTNSFQTSQAVTYGGRTVGTYTSRVYRLSQYIYLVGSTGTVSLAGPYSGASRSVAQLVRFRKADFDNETAFEVYGDLTVAGTSNVNGIDTYYPTWTDCTTKTGTSAVTTNTGSDVNTSGGGSITPSGSVTHTTLTSDNFTVFGDMTYNEIASLANFEYAHNRTVQPGAVLSGSTCVTSNDQNWGDPTSLTSSCRLWYPIMHGVGDLSINSTGTGQGILLVDGDLSLTGGFTFYGVVVVLGEVKTTGTGGHINGSLYAFGGGDLNSASFAGGSSLVQYSSCSIERAVTGSSKLARAYPVKNRSWFDVTNAQNSY
jgi:hypothetical protein